MEKVPALGDIIEISLDPQVGVETAKTRPVLVISRAKFVQLTGLIWICPITKNKKLFPTHVFLDDSTVTYGKIMVDQIRSLDFHARPWRFIEKAPDKIVSKVEKIAQAIISTEDESSR